MYTETIDFPFLRFLFECRVTGPLLYFTQRRGETIKGLIAREMKKLFPCDIRSSCEKCSIAGNVQDCEYVRFFRFDLCQKPFSYVIVPPLNPRSAYFKDEKFYFEIRLFGECARFESLIQYLAPAIEQGGLLSGIGNWYKEPGQYLGRFQLSRIYLWEDHAWKNIFKEEQGFLVDSVTAGSFYEQVCLNDKAYDSIRFYTPFCLKKNKTILSEPSLEDIVYFSVMRLRAIHGNRTLKIQNDIFERAGAIRATSFQFDKVFAAKNLSYFIGQVQFESIPPEFVPFLKLGSFSHIGKGITQGYGGYFLMHSQS